MPIALESTTTNTTVIQEAGDGSYTLTLPSKTDYLANRGYVDGSATITPAADGDVTLSPAQAATGSLTLVTGAWTQARNVIVPATAKMFWINNASIYDATIKTVGGTGTTVVAGRAAVVYCNGTNVVDPTSAIRSIGTEQTWQNVTASRAAATVYYNTTGRPIMVMVSGTAGVNSIGMLYATVNGVQIGGDGSQGTGSYGSSISFIVPPNGNYRIDLSTQSISNWSELR